VGRTSHLKFIFLISDYHPSLFELRPDKTTGQDGLTRKSLSEANAAYSWIKKSVLFSLLSAISVIT